MDADFRAQYETLAGRAVFFDLGDWARLRFRGPDAKSFLNGLLTNDVAHLPPLRGFPICLLTPKGKAQAEFLLYDEGDSLLALARSESAANIKAAIGKVLMLSETTMADLSSRTNLFLVAGPQAGQAPTQFSCDPTKGLYSYPRFEEHAFFILAPSSERPALLGRLSQAGAAVMETWRIEQKIPVFGRDLDEDTIPLEAGLEEAISYTKGCYMGQETISRIHHLGHVNRLLRALKVEGDVPSPGTEVLAAGKPAGRVTSACFSPKLSGALALAMLRADAAGELTVAGRPARVL